MKAFAIVNATLVLMTLAISGCVTHKELDEVRVVADRAIQDAATAKAAADAAMSAANQGKSAAAAAQTAAGQALQAAQSSQSCCDASNEKMDRMFQKSVTK
jgi:hypothetical protein